MLKVIVPEEHKDQRVFFNMNSNFGPGITDFAHGLGFELVKDAEGDYVLPGKFNGPDNDVSKWVYEGEMLGRACDVDLVIENRRDASGNAVEGKYQNAIKAFYCTIPDCTTKHSVDLTGKK
jgi:hypothetical protein